MVKIYDQKKIRNFLKGVWAKNEMKARIRTNREPAKNKNCSLKKSIRFTYINCVSASVFKW